MKRDLYNDGQLLELVSDLYNFILNQIVHVQGTYHDRDSDLGRNPQYQHIRETERLALDHCGMNLLGLNPELSMRGSGISRLLDGDDVHGLTIAFQAAP